jgi:hypothetical protein
MILRPRREGLRVGFVSSSSVLPAMPEGSISSDMRGKLAECRDLGDGHLGIGPRLPNKVRVRRQRWAPPRRGIDWPFGIRVFGGLAERPWRARR